MSGHITVVKGEEKPIKIYLKKPNGKPHDLTGATGITVKFQNADLSVLEKDLDDGVSITSEGGGEILCTLSEAETALLKSGARQALYVEIDVGSVKTIVTKGLEAGLSVVDTPF